MSFSAPLPDEFIQVINILKMTDINNKYLQDFLMFLEIERNYSLKQFAHIVQIYYSFLNMLVLKLQLKMLKLMKCKTFIQMLSRKNLSSRSLSRKTASLKSFYNYLFTFKLVDVNISSSLKSKKFLKVYLNSKANFKTTDYPLGSTFKELRDKLILELFYAMNKNIRASKN